MYRDGEQREFARKFRRQAAIGPYVVDFVCFSHKLVIEVDGVQHAEGDAPKHDARRTSWLESRGFRILRFWNHQLDDGLNLVLEAIWAAVEEATPSVAPSPHPSPPRRGEGAGGIV